MLFSFFVAMVSINNSCCDTEVLPPGKIPEFKKRSRRVLGRSSMRTRRVVVFLPEQKSQGNEEYQREREREKRGVEGLGLRLL